MERIEFASSPRPTLGVEIELALVNAESMALSSAIEPIRRRLGEEYATCVKQELMQCYLEINTGICETVADAEADLRRTLKAVQSAADAEGVRLLWAGTHPFSLWQDQTPSVDDRYARLLDSLKDMGRQLITFGLHVHVGVDSGDKAVMICDRIMRYLPIMLAMSANSPFWNNRVGGLMSHRSKIMEGLPTAGLPAVMRNWSEFVWLMNHLVDTGFINSIRDIWWDVRPHHKFGTVEVRVCDVPGNLHDTMGIVALIQSLIHALSEEIDVGTYQHEYHPMMVRQNKWRASRYGVDATLVDTFTFEEQPVREIVPELVRRLGDSARHLGCLDELQRASQFVERPGWANRQLALLHETGDPVEVVRRLTEASRVE
ncbi:MAG: YbdK family carboxylate-amine ligase [Pirellulales bacterium]